MTDQGEALGIDVGGTKINAFRVARDGEILARAQVSTPADDEDATVAAMIETGRTLMTADVLAVGVGAAGMVDAERGVLRFAPNRARGPVPAGQRRERRGIRRVSLRRRPRLPTHAARGRGDGHRRGHRHRPPIVPRGARVRVRDRPHHRGAGRLCGCGNHGCWEQVAAGRAIDRAGRAAAAEHPDSLLSELAGGEASRVDGKVVTEAAQRGDDVARGVLAQVGGRLGQGIAGLVNVLDPQVVVVGGGAILAGDLLLEPARAAFLDAVEAPEFRPRVPIVAAELGNDAGAVGAAALALEELGRLSA